MLRRSREENGGDGGSDTRPARPTLNCQLSRDYWFKIVDFLQQNWALIDPASIGCRVWFLSDTSGVFDQLDFPDIAITEGALRLTDSRDSTKIRRRRRSCTNHNRLLSAVLILTARSIPAAAFGNEICARTLSTFASYQDTVFNK